MEACNDVQSNSFLLGLDTGGRALLSAPGKAGADVGKPTIRIECSDMQSRIGRYGKEKGRLFRWRDCD